MRVEGQLGGLAEQRLMLSGSFSPGTWTRMRSSPWRWIVGSRADLVDPPAHDLGWTAGPSNPELADGALGELRLDPTALPLDDLDPRARAGWD